MPRRLCAAETSLSLLMEGMGGITFVHVMFSVAWEQWQQTAKRQQAEEDPWQFACWKVFSKGIA